MKGMKTVQLAPETGKSLQTGFGTIRLGHSDCPVQADDR